MFSADDELEEPVLVRVRGGCGAGGHAQLAENVRHVPIHGLFCNDEVGGDRMVGLAGRDQAKHLLLTRGQPMGGCARLLSGELLDPD